MGPVRLRILLCAATLFLVAPTVAAATIIRVPQDYPTVQAGIDAAVNGDTVRVSPGTYVERIDFHQKAITVESVDGPQATILDGGGLGPVVSIAEYTGHTPVFRGFTVRNGGLDGGISTYGGPVLIEQNWVTGLHSCDPPIEAAFSDATIRFNRVWGNVDACSGGDAGGIGIRGAGTARVIGNVITRNWHSFSGGGIGLFAAGSPLIARNFISGNHAGYEGGGISLVNVSNATIVNNFIVGNDAPHGGGIAWLVPGLESGPWVLNNTIAGNRADLGLAIYADGYDSRTRLDNNILLGSGSAAVVECAPFTTESPLFAYNDVFNAESGLRYGGDCVDQTGQNGNISADPFRLNVAPNFRLGPGSPAIDSAGPGPADDFDGDTRPIDGDGDGTPAVDMGADEYVPAGPRSGLDRPRFSVVGGGLAR